MSKHPMSIRQKEQREMLIRYVQNYLSGRGCIECNEKDTMVLEFHHRNPTDKKYDIATILGSSLGLSTLEEEIEKCDIYCRNCHKKAH